MSGERYSRLSEITQTEWLIGCPVEISKGVLLLDNQKQNVVLQLKLRNVGSKTLIQVDFEVKRFDLAGDLIDNLKDPVLYSYLDLDVKSKETFGDKNAVILGINPTRKVQIVFSKVIFQNGSVWRNENGEIGHEIQTQNATDVLGADLTDQYEREYRLEYPEIIRDNIYNHNIMPELTEEYWLCTCGFPNEKTNQFCGRCGVAKEWLFNSIEKGYLTTKLTEYQEAERVRLERLRLEEEERVRVKQERQRIKQEEQQRIEDAKRENEAQHKIIKKRRSRVAIIVVSILTVAISGLFVTTNIIIPTSHYNQAMSLFNEGKWSDAIVLFEELGEFEDSSSLLLECKYQSAIQLLDNREYEEAYSEFQDIKVYKQSIELSKNAMYELGNQLFDSKDYGNAISAYKKAEDYSDAGYRVDLAQQYFDYEEAQDLLSSGDAEAALKILLTLDQIDETSISIAQANKAIYDNAVDLFEDHDFLSAIDKFNLITDYEDSSDRMLNCKELAYEQAKSLLNSDSFTDAEAIFTQLENFKDAREYVLYIQARLLYLGDNESTKALEIFENLGLFLDSTKYVDIIDWGKKYEGTWVSVKPDSDNYYEIYVIEKYFAYYSFNSCKYSSSNYGSVKAYVDDSFSVSSNDCILEKSKDDEIVWVNDSYGFESYLCVLSDDGKTITLKDLVMTEWQPKTFKKIG